MIGQNIIGAIDSLRGHWQRAVLSGLGITIGTVAIILLISIAKGVQQDVSHQVQDIGASILVVIPGRIEDGTFNPNLGGGSSLEESDAVRVSKVPGIVRAVPWTFVGGGIRVGKYTASSLLAATTPDWFLMHPVELEAGRVFLPSDDLSDVCVIGSLAKKSLFQGGPAVGKPVTVNGRTFRVIGVTQDHKSEQSLFSMGGFQNLVYLPYHRLKQVQKDMQTSRVMIQIRPDVPPKPLIAQLDKVLAQRLDRQQFQVLTQEDLLGLVFKITGILTWLLTGLTSIALVVAGVGIMAVMLMSVNERSKEIGVRKTVGAKSLDIFYQFLTEAIMLSVSGGIVGLAFSAGVCELLRTYTPIKPLITFGTVLLAFGVSIGLGAFFGLLPALNAARKDPVAAMRAE